MTPVHPGEVLAETLADLSMTQADFAARTDLSPKHINRIVRGHAGYSAEVALRFERVTGVSAAFWLSLQAHYRDELARARS